MMKRFLYIFIPVLAVLLMSHNTYATTTNVVPSSVQVFYSVPGQNIINNITLSNLYTVSNSQDIKGWKLLNGLNINMVCYNLGTTVKKDSLFSFSFSAMNVAVGTISGGPNIKPHSLSAVNMSYFDNSANFRPTSYFITGHLSEDVNQLCIGDSGNVNNVVFFDDSYSVTEIYFLQPKINFYDENNPVNDTLNETKQETQDAADNSSTAGGSSSSDATSATSSLLSVIGAGIGAITTASPTNCRINGDMGNLDVGTIDLCANPVPAFVAVIGSIIAVLVVLPLVIILFNRFIGIIRSFQT